MAARPVTASSITAGEEAFPLLCHYKLCGCMYMHACMYVQLIYVCVHMYLCMYECMLKLKAVSDPDDPMTQIVIGVRPRCDLDQLLSYM